MVSKWTRAAFMIVLGFLLLIYGGGFVTDLETHASGQWNMSFEWTWDLLTYLIWIIIAWLFVYALLTIALSFKTDLYTMSDVMERLDRIETRLSTEKKRPSDGKKTEMAAPAVTTEEGDIPPPPRE